MLFGESTPPQLADRLLSQCAEAGVNFFDTAEMYPVPQRAETQVSCRSAKALGGPGPSGPREWCMPGRLRCRLPGCVDASGSRLWVVWEAVHTRQRLPSSASCLSMESA